MAFARCLATMKEHFEIIMQRFDVQDALLNQMITRRVGSKGREYCDRDRLLTNLNRTLCGLQNMFEEHSTLTR